MRELARAAGVSVATMRHYFGDREGVVIAAMEHGRALGQPHMLSLMLPPEGAMRTVIPQSMQRLVMGIRFGVGRVHSVGLAHGLENSRLGPAYVQEVLEPTLQSFEAHLAHFAARGEMVPCALRVAALTLVSPVLLAMLHQGPLGGSGCRPLDIDSFVHEHVARWLSAYCISAQQ